jgi:hypothetical protein
MKSSVLLIVLGIMVIGGAAVENHSCGAAGRTLHWIEKQDTAGGDSGSDLCCGELLDCQLPFPNTPCDTRSSLDCDGAVEYENPPLGNTRGCVIPSVLTYCFEFSYTYPAGACLVRYNCMYDNTSGSCFKVTPPTVITRAPDGCSAMGCD